MANSSFNDNAGIACLCNTTDTCIHDNKGLKKENYLDCFFTASSKKTITAP